MAEHVVFAALGKLFDFFGIPFVDVFERMAIPFGLDFRRVVSPAAQEVDGADDVVKRVVLEDVVHLVLLLEIADLDARAHIRMALAQLFHEAEIVVERVLELVRLQPFLLERADETVVENQVVIVELLELGERVAVLADADLVEAALCRRREKAFGPVLIIGAFFKMHVIVEFHQHKPSFMSHSMPLSTPASSLLAVS